MYRIFILIAFIAAGCDKKKTVPAETPQFKVIARFAAQADFDKICTAQYIVLNSVIGNLKPDDTINVSYYSYLAYDDAPETALLTLEKYKMKTSIKNYFIFPDYDPKKGIEPLNIAGYQSKKWAADTVYITENARVFATKKVSLDDIKEVQIRFTPYISFEDYKVEIIDNSKLASLDLSSHKYGRMFRTNLREAYKEEQANFGGHYTLATWGCGSPCQQSLLIDRYTGKIYDTPTSNVGVDFRHNSKMLIVNPPEEDGYYWDCPFCIPEIYVFNEKTKEFVKQEPK